MENNDNKNKINYECLKKHKNYYISSPDVENDHGCLECLKEFIQKSKVNKYLNSSIGTYCFSSSDIDIDNKGHIIPKLPIFLTNPKTDARNQFPDLQRKFLDIIKYQLIQEMDEWASHYHSFPNRYPNESAIWRGIKETMHLKRECSTIEKEIQEYRRKYRNFSSEFESWMTRSPLRTY